MRESGRVPARTRRRAVVREPRQPFMRLPVPAALVVPGQHHESDPAPPVRQVAMLPARLDAEPDFPTIILREQEPFDPSLDMPFERLVAEAVLPRIVSYHGDAGGAQIPEAKHLDLQQKATAEEWA